MARTAGLHVTGLSQVTRALLGMGLQVEDLKDAFSDIADEGARQVAQFAPRGATGRLAGDARGNRAKSKAVVTIGRASVPYAGAINYGWRDHNIAPAGFLQRADVAMRPYSVRRLEKNIDDIIKERGLT